MVPWSDLTAALATNGRTVDYRVLNPYGNGTQTLVRHEHYRPRHDTVVPGTRR